VQIKIITVLYVVLHRCKTWSFTLRQEHGLRAFMNRVLNRIHELEIKEIYRRMEETATSRAL
jgi:hypothetical protein